MFDNKTMFDLSDIKMEAFHDHAQKKAVGIFKPEFADSIIEEFIGLRSKMYSLKFTDGEECKKAKGVVQSVTRRDIRHGMYRQTLETGSKMYNKMNVIRSVKHQLYTMIINKISLSPFDDKRWIHADRISSLA